MITLKISCSDVINSIKFNHVAYNCLLEFPDVYSIDNQKNHPNMKHLTILLFSIIISGSISAQTTAYYPVTTGTQTETKIYDARGVVTGKTVHKVQSTSPLLNAEVTSTRYEIFDASDNSVGTGDYDYISRGPSAYVDMKKYLSPHMMKLFEEKNLEVEIQTAELEIPNANTTVGQTFSEATLTLTLSGNEKPFETFSIRIYNRVVSGTESLTTPAGTYQCKKITFDMEITSAGRTLTRWTEWWAPEVGCVKTEYFNEDGKLIGNELLTAVTAAN